MEPAPLSLAALIATAAYGVIQALLLVYSSHRWWVLFARRRGAALPRRAAPDRWPAVTVQLPLFNERRVAVRLLRAVAALDYPQGRLEVQVLDDSTDETADLVAREVLRLARRGLSISHLRRACRDGYKAGALEAGRTIAAGELLAVFDADFVPPRDFLRRLIPHFSGPRVGMVQARWSHLNRDHSWLTSAQAVLLDAHFALEHEARMRSGRFLNFNGTAGIWRRECLEQAGGWSADTLTEDLDVSYRAQLAGWRFVYDGAVEVPAELPERAHDLKSQQRRWVRGSIQTARKILPALLAGPLPFRVKAEALIHLTANAAYPLLIALGALLIPAVMAVDSRPGWAVPFHAALLGFGMLPVVLFLGAGQRALGRPWGRVVVDVPGALLLGAGLSLNNAIAVARGLSRRVGTFERTPKSGGARGTEPGEGYAPARAGGGLELALAVSFAGVAAFTVAAGHPQAAPLALLLAAGLGGLGLRSFSQGPRAARVR